MSGGGETLSSISEKSCISAGANQANGGFPPQTYLMVRICYKKQGHWLFFLLANLWPSWYTHWYIFIFSRIQEDNIPYSRSTYLIDPPTSFEQSQTYSNTFGNASRPTYVEDPMSLYSVVHKERKTTNCRNSMIQLPSDGGNSGSGGTASVAADSPCSIEQHMQNYEDTESEYASELRRQTYLQKIGKVIHSLFEKWGQTVFVAFVDLFGNFS